MQLDALTVDNVILSIHISSSFWEYCVGLVHATLRVRIYGHSALRAVLTSALLWVKPRTKWNLGHTI